MISLSLFREDLLNCIITQHETQDYLSARLPKYNPPPDFIKTFISKIYTGEVKEEEVKDNLPILLWWIVNNKCAIDDEFLEILEAFGGEYKKAVWKPWKKDFEKVSLLDIDTVITGEYIKNLDEEMIDMFHFILNLILILPDPTIRTILDLISENEILTKDDLDENSRKMFYLVKFFIISKNTMDKFLSITISDIVKIIPDVDSDNFDQAKLFNIITQEYAEGVLNILFFFLKMWGTIKNKGDFKNLFVEYLSKNDVNRNRWDSGY